GETIRGPGGTPVTFRQTVVADVTLSAGGAGNLVVTPAAIFETDGQYNTVASAPISTNVVTIVSGTAASLQPNLYYHKEALSFTTVPQVKLYATDTIATTKDGLSIRICKYSDGDANLQKIRFDLQPVHAVLNPFWGGQAYGL
ncbi:unnamed protein product, partial [marine sediment metagenome]